MQQIVVEYNSNSMSNTMTFTGDIIHWNVDGDQNATVIVKIADKTVGRHWFKDPLFIQLDTIDD